MDQLRGKFYEGLTQTLIEYAKFEFNLDLTFIEKASLRAHLVAAKAESELKNPNPFPEELKDQWEWFCELSGTGRGVGGSGSSLPLTATEIVSWCFLRDVHLLPWELRLIRLLDAAWLAALHRSG